MSLTEPETATCRFPGDPVLEIMHAETYGVPVIMRNGAAHDIFAGKDWQRCQTHLSNWLKQVVCK